MRRTLDPKRNPYFERAALKLFTCHRSSDVSGRVAVVINPRYEQQSGVKAALFGFFECIDDPAAAGALFSSAENYCRERGIELLEGPFNPNHYSELGLQISHFGTAPVFFQTYNPSYYPALLESAGYRVSACFYTSRNDSVKEYIRGRYGRLTEPVVPAGYTVRQFDMRHQDRDLEVLRDVFNDSFSSNWHFLPLSREEYRFSSKFLRLVTEPGLITIVEHRGMPVGVLMCVLDINPLLKRMDGKIGPIRYLRFLRGRREIRKLVVYAVGIRPACRNGRIFRLLLDSMLRMAMRYDSVETTWMSPANIPSIRASERLGLKPDKQFAIYAKHLTIQ